ncbi:MULTISPECIES: ribonuclease H family protein [unclassified Spirosoma]|mgnify:CR=1 FL=1|uniref:ribonuclease H family protein n=1 Tax=unclassified Spirosoma TaxID=2621999 RepID=UPI00095B33E3|nr:MULTISPECIES: ribonuclease H family protein [unclassified Spirosoma]MBN8821413.1 ribonuclease H family protein [Spirosoma sp.]OJW78197.1 MAG: ribonuclease H [Spirosoma sp. 48-14]
MAQKKPKYYVVWQGRKPGVYDSWDEAKAQTDGFAKPLFKSFDSKPAALKAFKEKPHLHMGQGPKSPAKQGKLDELVGEPILDSLVVDAAWNTATGDMEYQGIYLATRQRLFLKGPYWDGTNNIGEFLAIVHALALLHQKGSNIPVYSDSRTAIGWVKKKKANTKLEETNRNAELFELLDRAETWLQTHRYANPVLKWETTVWGENPADFGRK